MKMIRRFLSPASLSIGFPWLCLFLFVISNARGHPPNPNGSEPTLKELYEGHHWFALREAIGRTKAQSLYRGAVASAFNETREAEKDLTGIIHSAPKSEEADQARYILANLYQRLGKYRSLVRQWDEMLNAKPDQPYLRSLRDFFALLPDQSISHLKSSTVRAEISAGGITIPALINGRAVNYILDTGFTTPTISESEARMLGLLIQDARAKGGDPSSGQFEMRAAVAATVAIGRSELRNVVFLVVSDSQPPMNILPPGKRGILGLPAIVPLRGIRWHKDGNMTIGYHLNKHEGDRQNICFDNILPVTRMRFQNIDLDFILDTGNGSGTQLWSRFAREFTSLVGEQGVKAKKRWSEFQGSQERDALILPELTFHVGGFDAVLRPANVFPEENSLQHGCLGMDLLFQAKIVMIDFQSMILKLE